MIEDICGDLKARLPHKYVLETICQRHQAANHAIRSTDVLC
jgi:hypothetical protein